MKLIYLWRRSMLCASIHPNVRKRLKSQLHSRKSAQSLTTPNTERTPTVFVSYSHDDKEFAERLIRDLQAAGHAIWIDVSRLKGGDVWIRAISEGIINSYAFVVVATERSLGSSWVQDEITWAKQRGKLIIPLLLEDVLTHPDFFPLARYQGIKFFETDYDPAVRDLLAGLPAPPSSADVPIEPPKMTQRALELQYLDRLRFEVLLNTGTLHAAFRQSGETCSTRNPCPVCADAPRIPPVGARARRRGGD